MICEFEKCIELLKFVEEIVEKEKSITINSGIYQHFWDDERDEHGLSVDEDIIIIRGKKGNPITLNRIIRAFNKMKKQFDVLEEIGNGRTYCLEGFRAMNDKRTKFEVCWGS